MIRLVLIILFVTVFFIVTLPAVPVLLLTGVFNRRTRDRASLVFVRFAMRVIAALAGMKIEVYGRENIPEDQAVLYIGNHNSYFDIIAGYAVLKNLTGFISKNDLKYVPFLNYWMLLVNCLFLNRKDPRSGLKVVLEAARRIQSGISMFVFPEGKRSKDGHMLDFKEGTFKIATRSKCLIIPVAFTGTAAVFENHTPFVKPSRVTVTFGAPVDPSSYDRAQQKKLGIITRARIQEMLDAGIVKAQGDSSESN